jgi:hypothetical protein
LQRRFTFEQNPPKYSRNIDGALVKEEKKRKGPKGDIPGENVDNVKTSAFKTMKSGGEAEIVTAKVTEAPQVDIRLPAVDDHIEASQHRP